MNFILVMEALITDSPTVPSLLTEYILKGENRLVFCTLIIMYPKISMINIY